MTDEAKAAEEKKADKPEDKSQDILSLIEVNDKGALEPKNQSELVRYISALIGGKMIPKHLEGDSAKETIQKVLGAWNMAAQLNLPPLVAMRNIAIIQGTPATFGDLPLALARRTGDVTYFEEYCFDDEYKKICLAEKNLIKAPYGAVCFIQRGDGPRNEYLFTVDDAKKAGLWEKKSRDGKPTPWVFYPKVMLTRRARSMAIKAEFPDALMGAGIAEYDFHEAPDLRDVGEETTDKKSNLTEEFNSVKKVTPEVVP